MQLDWFNERLYVYVAIGSGVVLVLALLLYLVPGGRIKVPAILASSLACLAGGMAAGMFVMASLGYKWTQETQGEPPAGLSMGFTPNQSMQGMGGGQGGPRGGSGGGRAGPGGGPGGGGPGGGGPGGGGPGASRGGQAKGQLASLVVKLDQLTNKPLTVELTTDQKKKIGEQLQGLQEKDDLSDEDAKKRLDVLLETLKPARDTFEAAGYRWPGEGGAGRPSAAAPGASNNPFKADANQKHLKSLQARLNG